MNEALVKNTFHHAKPQFDNLKNSLSDNFKINDTIRSEKTSFDTYLKNDNPSKPLKKASISEKSTDSVPKNQTQKITQQKDNQNDQTTSSDSGNDSKTTTPNNETDDTDNQTTLSDLVNNSKITIPDNETDDTDLTLDDTTEETLEMAGGFILNLTETMIPLPQNTSDEISTSTDLTGLDNGELSLVTVKNIDDNLELNGEVFELIASDTIDNTQNTDSFLVNSTDLDDTINIANIALDFASQFEASTEISAEVSTKAIDSFVVNQNFSSHSNFQIQIQKLPQIELIAQLPLQNDISLNITKDIDNDNKIGINLEPAGMGSVELTIETNKDNAVTAVIRSDKPEILEQLRKESASLERYLTEAGLNLGGNGLSFEHKQQQDDNQNSDNKSNQMLNASISETSFSNNNNIMSATERLYANLDKQSIQTGLDIRL